ncbi:hypothetical protein EB052_00955 [bacterium]|nr:hypothetical protein [bacterium]
MSASSSLLPDVEASIQEVLSAKVDQMIALIPPDYSKQGDTVTTLRRMQVQIKSAQTSSVFLRWGEIAFVFVTLPPLSEAPWVEEILRVYNV